MTGLNSPTLTTTTTTTTDNNSSSNNNNNGAGAEEEEDAALVDSFFLPGGILDPDFSDTDYNALDQERSPAVAASGRSGGDDDFLRTVSGETATTTGTSSMSIAIGATTAPPRRVPSNPWGGDSTNNSASSQADEENDPNEMISIDDILGGTEGHCPLHPPPTSAVAAPPPPQPSGLLRLPETPDGQNNIHLNGNNHNVSSPTIRPPPGYAEFDRGKCNNKSNKYDNSNTDDGIDYGTFNPNEQHMPPMALIEQRNSIGMGHPLDMNPMNLSSILNGGRRGGDPTAGGVATSVGEGLIPFSSSSHIDRPIQRPSHSDLLPRPSDDERLFLNGMHQHQQPLPHEEHDPEQQQSQNLQLPVDTTLGVIERRLIDGSGFDFLPPSATNSNDMTNVLHPNHISPIRMDEDNKGNNSENNEADDDNGDDDDDDDDEESEESSVASNPSIPLELLSIRGIYKGDSLTSSLSTSTCDSDAEQETLSVIDIDGELENELEDIADHAQESALVDLDVDLGVSVSVIGADSPGTVSDKKKSAPEQTSTPSTTARTGAATSSSSSVVDGYEEESEVSCSAASESMFEVARTRLREVWIVWVARFAAATTLPDSQALFHQVEQSKMAQSLRQMTDSLSSQLSRFMAAVRVAVQWVRDVQEVLSLGISQILYNLRVVLVTLTKALILLASFLFQIWKYALVEAVEETHVTICYMVFYLMPRFCSILMEYVNLPHWTPHLITSTAIFTLCHQVKAGPLHTESSSILFNLTTETTTTTTSSVLSETENDKTDKSKNGTSTQDHSKQHDHPSRISSNKKSRNTTAPTTTTATNNTNNTSTRDERACRTILRILRFFLPIFFLADGFSSEFGTIIGDSGDSRLITAFMMSLVRKNLVSTPIGWISWAVQVLVATYYPSSSMVDQVVLVVGLSSIRLIRYLEGQRVIDKNSHSNNYKTGPNRIKSS